MSAVSIHNTVFSLLCVHISANEKQCSARFSSFHFLSRSPLSDTEKQGRINVAGRTSYYPQTPNKRPPNRRQRTKICLKHNALTILTVLGVVGGIVLGLVLRSARSSNWPAREIMYVNYMGELFLRMLKSLILPLIMSSLISAIGSLDLSLSGKIGARAIVYYMVTTVTAVITGTFHP